MAKINRRSPELTRQRLVDPQLDVPFRERLKRAHAIDLRGNMEVERLASGYARAIPVDRSVRWEEK